MKKTLGWRIFVIGILLAVSLQAVPLGQVNAAFVSPLVFSLQIDLPEGARIEYLRMYYYDTNPVYESISWITTYDGASNGNDLTVAYSSGASGFGEGLSPFVNQIVDNMTYTYVLNWRPQIMDSSMRLMGMRIAYRMPDGVGGWANFSYLWAAGSTFTPRTSMMEWRYGGLGSVYAASWDHFLPFLSR